MPTQSSIPQSTLMPAQLLENSQQAAQRPFISLDSGAREDDKEKPQNPEISIEPQEKESEKQTIVWTETEDKQLFELYKCRGAVWSLIAKDFPGRTENQVKNRFYSTLRRVATKKIADKNLPPRSSIHMSKEELLQYVEDALEYGHNCFSKRGRKKKRKDKSLQPVIPLKKLCVESGESNNEKPANEVPVTKAPLIPTPLRPNIKMYSPPHVFQNPMNFPLRNQFIMPNYQNYGNPQPMPHALPQNFTQPFMRYNNPIPNPAYYQHSMIQMPASYQNYSLPQPIQSRMPYQALPTVSMQTKLEEMYMMQQSMLGVFNRNTMGQPTMTSQSEQSLAALKK